MKYLKVNEKLEVVEVSDNYPKGLAFDSNAWYKKFDGSRGAGWLNRNYIDSFLLAQALADSASKLGDAKYIASDSGPNVSPRFDVIEAPKIGDEVSKAFNGDYYPMGKITRIGKDFKQIKVSGARGDAVFYRSKLSGAWLYKGMWRLVPGVVSERNQEF